MHDLEPHYHWRDLYTAEEDSNSPFYGREYSEFEFSDSIYDHYIHPQWDNIGSSTLYLKLLFTDYDRSFCIIELIGEWNDAVHNDIMYLKREIADPLIDLGIKHFILLGENIMNYHYDTDDYYQEWFEDIDDGWIVGVNFRPHVVNEFSEGNIDYYILFGGQLENFPWRTFKPTQLFERIDQMINKRLTA